MHLKSGIFSGLFGVLASLNSLRANEILTSLFASGLVVTSDLK